MTPLPNYVHLQLETHWFLVEARLAIGEADPEDPTARNRVDTFRVYVGEGTTPRWNAVDLYLWCGLPLVTVEVNTGARSGASVGQVARAMRDGVLEVDHPVVNNLLATNLARRALAWALRRARPTQTPDWLGIGA